MRVLMLNYEYPPLGGGAANACHYMLKEFAKRGDICIDLITSSEGAYEIEEFSTKIRIFKLNVKKKDLHFWRISEILRWSIEAYRLSQRLVGENCYDLCHCWFGWPCGVLGYISRKKLPYIVALRGSDMPGYNRRLKIPDKFVFKNISKFVWENARFVTVLSRNSLNLARKTDSKIDYTIIPNGIDSKEFYSKDKSMNEIGILYVGRFIERKGIKYLVEAFSELLKKHDNITLTLVGSGNTMDQIASLCDKNELSGKVNILGPKLHTELPEIYNSNDILVIPSLEEALSNVISEAMASGLAIVTTDTGASELLDKNGLIIEKESSEDIYKKLDYLINHPDLILDMKKRSVEISKDMSWQKCMEAYLELYELTRKSI